MLKWCRKQANPEPNIMSYFGETETDRSGNAMFAEENGLIKQITNGWINNQSENSWEKKS